MDTIRLGVCACVLGLTMGCHETPKPVDRASHANITVAPAADTAPDLSPAARRSLDSGNALFRARRYEGALEQYRLTVQRAPGDPTPYYGIYMVAQATNNRPLADSASTALRKLGVVTVGELPSPSRSR